MSTQHDSRRARRVGAVSLCATLVALAGACGSSASRQTAAPAIAARTPNKTPPSPSTQLVITASPPSSAAPATGLSTSGSVPPGSGVIEREGSRGAPTFTNPLNPTTAGTKVPPWSYVRITCRTMTTPTAIPTAYADGWVYLLESAPWQDKYYAVANTFWNGDIPGDTPYQHNEDSSIPICQPPIPGES